MKKVDIGIQHEINVWLGQKSIYMIWKGSVESHSNVKKSKLDWNVKVVGQVKKVGNQRDRYSKYS